MNVEQALLAIEEKAAALELLLLCASLQMVMPPHEAFAGISLICAEMKKTVGRVRRLLDVESLDADVGDSAIDKD